jgi:hypothetical protein
MNPLNETIKRLALISNPIIWLKNYLTMNKADRGRELASYSPYWFVVSYVGNLNPELDPESDEVEKLESEYLEHIDNYGFDDFSRKMGITDELFETYFEETSAGFADDPQAPSFLFMDYYGVVKNDWLIHFSSDAWEIASDGFKYGIPDLENLGLTVHLPREMKEVGGYNFAFDTSDLRYAFGKGGVPKYGSGAVMFRASGIKVYHYSDEEYQVVFAGESAKDFVYIHLDPNTYEWQVGDHPRTGEPVYKSEKLDDVATWVENNYNQYKRILK